MENKEQILETAMRAALNRKEYTKKLLSDFQTDRYRTAYEDACEECFQACERLLKYYKEVKNVKTGL